MLRLATTFFRPPVALLLAPPRPNMSASPLEPPEPKPWKEEPPAAEDELNMPPELLLEGAGDALNIEGVIEAVDGLANSGLFCC